METEYQLGPIPNYREAGLRPQFYVGHRTAGSIVGVTDQGSLSFHTNLERAQVAAEWMAEHQCPWSIDYIVEVLPRQDGAGVLDHSWEFHPAFRPAGADLIESYPDAGSW